VLFKFKRSPTEKLDFIIAGAQKAAPLPWPIFSRATRKSKCRIKDELHRTIQPARHFLMTKNGSAKPRLITRHCKGAACGNANRFCWAPATPIYIYWRTAMERIWNYNS